MYKNIPQTKTCRKCGEKKDRSEFVSIYTCVSCMDKELKQFKAKRKRAAVQAKKEAKEMKNLKSQKAMQAQLALDAWTALRAMCKEDGECPYRMTCEHKDCPPDQRGWCRLQQAFMFEADAKRREKLVWDFVLSFQDLMKNIIKKHVARKTWARHLEMDDIICQMNMVLARRFIKMMDEGTYVKKTNLKGYLSVSTHGGVIDLLKTNGIGVSLDYLMENGFHGLGKEWVA